MYRLETFFEYNDRKVYFKIVFKNKKNITIKVNNSGEVFVSSPYGVSCNYINNLVKNNAKWIVNEIDKKKEKSLFEENKIFYKGNIYNIIVNIQEKESIRLADSFIIVNSKSNDNSYIYELINKWYKKKSMEILNLRVDLISRKLGLRPSKIFIKNQKTIWGSCNSKKEIRLNWRLILMKESVMDYVIIHELCHIVHMNHSKDFWSLVEKYDPNYKANKLWLKENGAMLMRVT